MKAWLRLLPVLAAASVCLGSDCGGGTRSYGVEVVADGTAGGEATYVDAVVSDEPGWSGGPIYRELVRVELAACAASLSTRIELEDFGQPPAPEPVLTVTGTTIQGPDILTPRCPDGEVPPYDAMPSVSCGSRGGERWLVVSPTCTPAATTVSAAWLDATGARARPDLELPAELRPVDLEGMTCEVGDDGLAVVGGPLRAVELDASAGSARVVESETAVHDVAAGATSWAWVRAQPGAPECAELAVRAWGGDAIATFPLDCGDDAFGPAAGKVASRPEGFTAVYPLSRYQSHHTNVLDVDLAGAETCRERFDWQDFVPPR